MLQLTSHVERLARGGHARKARSQVATKRSIELHESPIPLMIGGVQATEAGEFMGFVQPYAGDNSRSMGVSSRGVIGTVWRDRAGTCRTTGMNWSRLPRQTFGHSRFDRAAPPITWSVTMLCLCWWGDGQTSSPAPALASVYPDELAPARWGRPSGLSPLNRFIRINRPLRGLRAA